MSYHDFLEEFAHAQGVGDRDSLLANHAERYSFQIKSRDRANAMVKTLGEKSKIDFKGLRVLDIGCAYGSFTIELAKIGAHVVGIDISDKWLKLADANARGEVDAKFINCDASSYRAVAKLIDDGPFDLFIVNDVFEHIYDTVGLLDTINRLKSEKAQIYFKIPNGLATRHVLKEGHKKVFGISLLAPDYWSHFIETPFHIYYRRWAYFQSLFESAGFSDINKFVNNNDSDIKKTRRFIVNDVNKIRRHITRANYPDNRQYGYLKAAAGYYFEEVEADLQTLSWDELRWKYRVTFWEGMLSST